MNAILQDVIVSVVALAAGAIFIRQSIAAFVSKPSKPGCGSCRAGCPKPNPTASGTVQQVILLRR